MVAGLLRNSGYYQGDDYVPQDPSNPKGYFEDRIINQINDRLILRHTGKDWLHKLKRRIGGRGVIPAGVQWLALPRSPIIVGSNKETSLVMKERVSHEPFCYKDPRFCHTLAAWKPILPRHTRFVVVFRDPVSTANSILTRKAARPYATTFRMSFMDAGKVWYQAYKHVLEGMESCEDYLFLDFQEVIDGGAFRSIEGFLDTTIDTLFADARLSRSNGDYEGSIPGQWRQMYDRLRSLAQETQRVIA